MSSSNHFKVLPVLMVWLFVFANLLVAQNTGEAPSLPILAALDIDGNGILSSEEIEKASSSLRMLDRNLDGQLARDEMFLSLPGQGNVPSGDGQSTEQQPKMDFQIDELVERFFLGDDNRDGVLSGDEVPEKLRHHLLSGDADGDDALNRVELRRVLEIRLRGTSGSTQPKNSLTEDGTPGNEKLSSEETDTPTAGTDGKVTPGDPLTLRIMEGLDTLLIKGDAADVAAIKEAFEKARESLRK